MKPGTFQFRRGFFRWRSLSLDYTLSFLEGCQYLKLLRWNQGIWLQPQQNLEEYAFFILHLTELPQPRVGRKNMVDSLERQTSNPGRLTPKQLESKHSSSALHDTVHKGIHPENFQCPYLPMIRIKSFLFCQALV